ncbi:CheR family methyltransferase [Ethanoligenens sp.]|uniref:CheR family methyltransferase n=1 Tax=Ethanoligenens sp. TaxID=2099655 RepID=UPI0039E88DB7
MTGERGIYHLLTIGQADFERLTGYMRQKYGINLSKKKVLIEGRLSNMITERGFADFHTYLNAVFADGSGQEITTLLNRLTTNHTYFMRESNHFDYFRDTVLPHIESTETARHARVWCAGCSTGEEPYTLQMILKDRFAGRLPAWNTQLLATDISERAMAIAKEGVYPVESVNNMPALWKMRYFEKMEKGMHVKEAVRRDVLFQPFNLMTAIFPFRQKFHVIFCRNVMIYFERDTKIALVNKFYQCLEKGGYLFIGHSESIERGATPFQYVMPAVYRRDE